MTLRSFAFRPFWISWDQGKIQVGKSDRFGENTFMSWDGLKFGVNFISVGVGYGSDAHWQFTSGMTMAVAYFLPLCIKGQCVVIGRNPVFGNIYATA